MINMEYTNLEQKILKILPEGKIVTHHTISDVNESLKFTDEKTLNNTIHNLSRKKGLLRLRRGLYFVTKGKAYDRIVVSSYVYGGYAALDTALFVYGYQQSQSNTLYSVTSKERKKETVIDGSKYVCVPMGRMGFGSVSFRGYKVSTKAKTLFDCIYNLIYLDDKKPLIALAFDLKESEFEEFMNYADKLDHASFYQRAGYVFDIAKAKGRFLRIIASKIEAYSVVKLVPKLRDMGNYVGKWHIYDNAGLASFLQV